MTENVTVDTTCDHCKTTIDDPRPRWVLRYDARAQFTPPDSSYPLGQEPTPGPRHLCEGCAEPVLGTIIADAPADGEVATATTRDPSVDNVKTGE